MKYLDSQQKIKKIVIVDDNETQLKLLELLLNQRGFQPISFLDPLKALEHIKINKADLLITDFNMPNMNGVELIREVKKINPYMQTAIVSAFSDETVNLQIDCDGLNSPLLHKPFDALAFQEFMKLFDPKETTKVVCIRKSNKKCHLRDKVASKFCMVCCLDDKEDDKEIIQNAVDAIDDFAPNAHMLLHVSAKLSYMANTLSMLNYREYSDIFVILKQLVVILHEKAQNITECDDIMMLVSSYLEIIREWLYDTFIIEKDFDQFNNNHDSIVADFESIQYALGLNAIPLEEIDDIDDLFF